ncbi:hypothetical protein AGMMS50212_11890 [Spirochaetia bacterium]|nr:hypothetical protein AGMMS50212_11890 [Spirochaetia bacterium]
MLPYLTNGTNQFSRILRIPPFRGDGWLVLKTGQPPFVITGFPAVEVGTVYAEMPAGQTGIGQTGY